MKTHIALCMALCTILTATALQTAAAAEPAWLPIGSKAELAAYAVSEARSGGSSISSPDTLYTPGDKTGIWVTGTDADDVAKKLIAPSESFSFRLSDASKASGMYLSSYMVNEEGDFLFWSNAQIKTVPNGNGKLKFDPSVKLSFRLTSTIPIRMPNVTWAEIRYEKPDGSRWTENLGEQRDGKLRFPASYAGTSGILVLTTTNNGVSTQTGYSLSTGSSVPGVNVTGNASASVIENHFSATDKGLAASTILPVVGTLVPPAANQYELVTPPTATFTVTKSSGTRICTAMFTVEGHVVPDRTAILEASALDYAHIAADGTIEEILASSVIVTKQGTNSVITVTWNLHNNAQEPEGTRWSAYLKIRRYEEQVPPSPPYYGGGQG